MKVIVEMSELEFKNLEYKRFLKSELEKSQRLIESAYQKMKAGSYSKDTYKFYVTQKFRQRILKSN